MDPQIELYLDEVSTFPGGLHDDEVDAVSLLMELFYQHKGGVKEETEKAMSLSDPNFIETYMQQVYGIEPRDWDGDYEEAI